MSGLEDKLIELGYELSKDEITKTIFGHKLNGNFENHIIIKNNKIVNCYVCYYEEYYIVKVQQDIDNLQEAFNEMQKDLKILKEYENEKSNVK